jgi:chemotaxis protein MotA
MLVRCASTCFNTWSLQWRSRFGCFDDCVFGVFIVHGGDMAPMIKAAPCELCPFSARRLLPPDRQQRCGVGTGFAAVGKVFKGPKYHKDDYLAVILVVSKILKTLKAEGAVALEPHIENPESSAIFAEYPPMLQDHALMGHDL